MRTASRLVLSGIVLSACAESPGPDRDTGGAGADTSAAAVCTGGPTVPAGFPQLGPGCATHVIFHTGNDGNLHVSDDEARRALDVPATDDGFSARGARPIPGEPGAYDFGLLAAPTEDQFFWLAAFWFPNLEPGIHRDTELFAVRMRLGTLFAPEGSDSAGEFPGTPTGIGAAVVDIAGRSDQAVWGRYAARLCDYECRYTHGTFAAAIETEPSELPFGPRPIYPAPDERHGAGLCFADAPECPTSDCATFPCREHLCWFTPDDTLCAAGAYCDPAGCTTL